MAKRVGMFGLGWEDVTDFSQKADKVKEHLTSLKNAWIYWYDGGGALTKKVAEDCAAFIRSEIYSQNAFEGMPDISELWREIKTEFGYSQLVGIASGDLVSSIRPINQGSGRWKVGISRNEKSISHGTVQSVLEYAKMLEYGYGPVLGKDGKTYYQPPRPFFSKSFIQWSYRALPTKIASTIYRSTYDKLLDLYTEVGKNMPQLAPEDFYGVQYAGEGATEAQEVFQETTQITGGSIESMESSELGAGAPGVVGRPDADATQRRIYFESERTEGILEGKEGSLWTESGDIWNEQEGMWQDMQTYMERAGWGGES